MTYHYMRVPQSEIEDLIDGLPSDTEIAFMFRETNEGGMQPWWSLIVKYADD